MKLLRNNKNGYVATIGTVIILIFVTIILFFMFSINKSEQSSISSFKDSLFNSKMNNKIALERIAGLYHKDLGRDDDLIDFPDINKTFKVTNVSDDFKVSDKIFRTDTYDQNINLYLKNKSPLTIRTRLTDSYEDLLLQGRPGDLDIYGGHDVSIKKNNLDITNTFNVKTRRDYTTNNLTKSDLEAGNYEISINFFGKDFLYSTRAKTITDIEARQINRVMKLTELVDDEEGRVYYLKLEDNTNLLIPPEEDPGNIIVQILDEKDLLNLSK